MSDASVGVRESLAESRGRGEPWEVAWESAVRTATAATATRHRGQWRKALWASEAAWRAAYEGQREPACMEAFETLRFRAHAA